MNIREYSDLHFEFHADGGRSFVESLDARGVDLLVLAGDITKMAKNFERSLGFFRRKFDCPIIYVHGNHEFYESTRPTVTRATQDAVAKMRGVYWLDCGFVEIDGVRILGTPLWYGKSRPPEGVLSSPREWLHGVMRMYNPELKKVVAGLWPDFECIGNFVSWVYNENERAIRFFLDNLREGDVVVTHMLPSLQCVPVRFERMPTNPFFVTELRHLIADRKPALWIHGHTHDSVDRMIGETRVVCNPLGYVPQHLNPTFDPRFTINRVPLTVRKQTGTEID